MIMTQINEYYNILYIIIEYPFYNKFDRATITNHQSPINSARLLHLLLLTGLAGFLLERIADLERHRGVELRVRLIRNLQARFEVTQRLVEAVGLLVERGLLASQLLSARSHNLQLLLKRLDVAAIRSRLLVTLLNRSGHLTVRNANSIRF